MRAVEHGAPVLRPPRVLLITHYFPPAYLAGGPPRSLDALVRATEQEIEYWIATSSRDLGSSTGMEGILPDVWTEWSHSRVRYISSRPHISTWRRIITEVNPDLVYINSFFDTHYSIVPLLARRLYSIDVPALIAPRGELIGGALAIHPVRKRVYLSTLRRMLIDSEDTYHASNGLEADSIRVCLGDTVRLGIASDIPQLRFPNLKLVTGSQPHDHVRAIYLGRIAPNKNLLGAVDALHHVHRPIHLTIVGPIDDQKYWPKVQKAIASLPSHASVTYRGAVEHDRAIEYLRDSEVLILPTFGENFGHVIPEALLCGLHAIIGPDTPFSQYGADTPAILVCDPTSPTSIAAAIESFACRSSQDRVAANLASQATLQQHFSEEHGKQAMLAVIREACRARENE